MHNKHKRTNIFFLKIFPCKYFIIRSVTKIYVYPEEIQGIRIKKATTKSLNSHFIQILFSCTGFSSPLFFC